MVARGIRSLTAAAVIAGAAYAQDWQLLINQAPPAALQSFLPYGAASLRGAPYIFSVASGQCGYQQGNSWSIDSSAAPPCVELLGNFTPIADMITGSWVVAGTPQVPNVTACNGTGFTYTSSLTCGSSGGSQQWVQMSRNPAWAAHGPRYGHQLQFVDMGTTLLGGFNATPGGSYGAPLRDVWYTGPGAFYYDVFYRGDDLPAACFDAASGAPRYASFRVLNRATAALQLFVLCSPGAATPPSLWSFVTGRWVLVGVTRGLTVATGGGAEFSLAYTNGVAPDTALGQVIINVQVEAQAEGQVDGAGGRRAQGGASPSPSPTPAAYSPTLPTVYGCLVAAGGGTGGVATSVDGVTWRYVNSSMVGVYGTRRRAPGVMGTPNSNQLVITGGRGDCLFNDSATGGPGVGDPVCTDTWTLPPETCCVTAFNAATGEHELCSGNGECTPFNRNGVCTCFEGASGALCEVGVPTSTPAGTPSATPSNQHSGALPAGTGGVAAALAAVAVVAALAARA